MVKAVVGANWGDEGKGKITDTLADSADVVIRFQGGANAGHTIVNKYGKFALHTLPSGAFHQNVMNIIGNGVALNIPILFKEIQDITAKGVPTPQLMISDRCQIVMPYHILFDKLEEERLAGKSFGSTKSGIAPFYSDKYAKIGFQVNELFQDEAVLAEKIADVCVKKDILLVNLYHTDPIDQKELLKTLLEYRDMIAPYVGNVAEYLDGAIKEGKTILLEGQLGTMKDPDHGIYPMVTSSSTLAAYGAIGAGIPPYVIEQIVVVNKAYSSAVGAGEFTSEIFGEKSRLVRLRGLQIRLPPAGRDRCGLHCTGRSGISGRDPGLCRLRHRRRTDHGVPCHTHSGEGEARMEEAPRLEVRNQGHQELRGSSGELQGVYRVYRAADRLSDHNGLQRTRQRRHHLPQVPAFARMNSEVLSPAS